MITNNPLSSEKILLASGSEAVEKLQNDLSTLGLSVERAITGKETQDFLYKKKYSLLILDIDLTSYSSIEVLKYIKAARLSLKILLYAADKKTIEDRNLDDKKLQRLGIQETVYSSSPQESIIQQIRNHTQLSSWKNIKQNEEIIRNEEFKIADSDFTKINIKEVLKSKTAVIDHYIRLSHDKYVKVVHKGEAFPVQEIETYENSGEKFLYFLNKDRTLYINYMNENSEEMIHSTKAQSIRIFTDVKNTVDKFIEEIHTNGIKRELITEGKKICQNIFTLVKKDKNLNEIMEKLQNEDLASFSHSFLVTFYSVVICKNLTWVGPKTIDTIALGSLLHDIGLLKIPKNIRESKGRNLTPEDFDLFTQHPRLGAEMLETAAGINEQVRQIIYQHHELLSGSGYPNGLTGIKIYPLAKIVSLADGFSDCLTETRLPPKEAMKNFLKDRENIKNYDLTLVRALVLGLI